MPSPILISCQEISKAFGDRPLFRGLTFAIHERDHIGFVGPNGAGKSTLLRILAGVETPDDGLCARRKGLRVGYVPQHPVFTPGLTLAETLAEALAGDQHLDARERGQRISVALSKIACEDPEAHAETLSGGWRTRLAIARALAMEPDLLLLDEPTNHLDLESRLWLESFLLSEANTFVVVSHDRYFLQNVGRRMFDIDRVYARGLVAVDGTYADLLETRNSILSRQASYEESLANRVRHEIEWLRRGPKARTRKSKARIDAAHRGIEELDGCRERSRTASAGIDLAATGRKTKRLWSCEGLAKRFGDRPVVPTLDLLLTAGTRLGIVGPNGSGKTTLLRMIVGDLVPDAGQIRRADALRIAYFDQNRRTLDPAVSLRRALAPDGDSVVYRESSVHVASWAKRFLFRTEQLETPVARLSGGERARIVLARLMLQPADLLVLDEPTNDLDIPTLEVLEESLLDFPGALVLVTHDRHLLDRIATSILALDGVGGIERYADYAQWESEAPKLADTRLAVPVSALPKPPPAKARRLSYVEQREWEGMEDTVLAAEARLVQATSAAEDPSIVADATTLATRLTELDLARREVDSLYSRWAELEAKLN
jgi:ABC transport system ATP-binding/permease protein